MHTKHVLALLVLGTVVAGVGLVTVFDGPTGDTAVPNATETPGSLDRTPGPGERTPATQSAEPRADAGLERTRQLLGTAPVYDGQYSALRSTTPRLYSTYHFLKAANHSAFEVANARQTGQWLHNVSADRFGTVNGSVVQSSAAAVSLTDYYYYHASTRYLPSTNSRVDPADIPAFQAENGGFCGRIARGNDSCLTEPSLRSTQRAIAVLTDLDGADPNRQAREYVASRIGADGLAIDFRNATNGTELSRLAYRYDALDRIQRDLGTRSALDRRRASLRDQRALLSDRIRSYEITHFDAHHIARLYQRHGLEPPKAAITELRARERRHGGFGLTKTGRLANSKATAEALVVLANANATETGGSAQRRDWIRYHELRTGGFAPVSPPDPSLRKTYYAALSKRNLGLEPGPAARRTNASGIQIDYMQCRLSAAVFGRSCGGLNYSSAYSASDLRTVFYATYIANRSGQSVPTTAVRETVREHRQASGRYGASTFETYYAVGALHYAGATPRKPAQTVAWIRDRRAEDGGYRLTRGSREAPAPDLLATYASVRTLHWLDAEPRNESSLATWVRGLESPDGGFHFAAERTTPPSLASIYYGTTVLDTLAADP